MRLVLESNAEYPSSGVARSLWTSTDTWSEEATAPWKVMGLFLDATSPLDVSPVVDYVLTMSRFWSSRWPAHNTLVVGAGPAAAALVVPAAVGAALPTSQRSARAPSSGDVLQRRRRRGDCRGAAVSLLSGASGLPAGVSFHRSAATRRTVPVLILRQPRQFAPRSTPACVAKAWRSDVTAPFTAVNDSSSTFQSGRLSGMRHSGRQAYLAHQSWGPLGISTCPHSHAVPGYLHGPTPLPRQPGKLPTEFARRRKSLFSASSGCQQRII